MNRKEYRYYDFVMAAFVTVLLCSNLIGVAKLTTFFGFTCTTGIFFFPLSYIFGDILTEVYGYSHSRKVVWAGFVAMAFASLMSYVVVTVTPAPGWPHQQAVETIFGSTWRIFIGSLTAFFLGEFANSYVLAKMKVWSEGKHLWMRTIGSTIVGEAIDSMIFYPVAFLGVWPAEMVWKVLLGNYAIKVLVEVVMTPVTYRVVAFLKRVESEDYYDRQTNFNPFKLNE